MSAKAILSASVSAAPVYVEDVFSTFVYTGTSAPLTITNGIDLAGEGGLVWSKWRSGSNAFGHALFDTARGPTKQLQSQTTAVESTQIRFTSFNSNGYTLSGDTELCLLANLYCSWTFRKAPKFFDVVTYTGDGSGAGRDIPHNLASKPGCVIVKCISSGGTNWPLGFGNSDAYLYLNSTAASPQLSTGYVDNFYSTATTFRIDGQPTDINVSGQTYVAYLFAHNAGGFGTAGTDNVVSCGSYAGTGSTAQDITLGYEPQWLMIKRTDTTDQWMIVDNMRGFFKTADNALCANTSTSEAGDVSVSGAMQPTATGFTLFNANSSVNASGGTYIYIAIRRGPMKVPTVGTEVFSAVARTGTGTTAVITTPGFPPDMTLVRNRNNYADSSNFINDRLRGTLPYVLTQSTNSEASNYTTQILSFDMAGFTLGSDQINGGMNYSSAATYINYFFRRAPSFFDVVCFNGSNSNFNVAHNLGVVPELIITKKRNTSSAWFVFSSYYPGGFGAADDNYFTRLNLTNALAGPGSFFSGTITSTNIPMTGNANYLSGETVVAYLFATCAGVSKVGSYTGNGTTQTINCGFTSGARFVLIKRTDSTGSWYVWDTARGIVSADDPYLLLNSTAAEVTNTDYIDPLASGFEISSTAPAEINANGGSYIFLAVA